MGGWGGWLVTDNKTISVQLNLTGTATGTELGNNDDENIGHYVIDSSRPPKPRPLERRTLVQISYFLVGECYGCDL